MSTRADLLLTLLAFAGIASLPVLLPWVAIRVMVGLLEGWPRRPSRLRLTSPRAEPAVEVTELLPEEEPVADDPRGPG